MNSIINEISGSDGRFQAATEENNDEYWKYDWFTPVKSNPQLGEKQQHNNNNNNNNNYNNPNVIANNTSNEKENENGDGGEEEIEYYPFKLKKWQKTNEPEYKLINDTIENGNEFDCLLPLNLNQFNRNEIKNRDLTKMALEKNKRVDEDSLTEKDIRGAVGGSGSIPGLSSGNNEVRETNNHKTEADTNNDSKTTEIENGNPENQITNIEENVNSTQISDLQKSKENLTRETERQNEDVSEDNVPVVAAPVNETPSVETPVDETPIDEPHDDEIPDVDTPTASETNIGITQATASVDALPSPSESEVNPQISETPEIIPATDEAITSTIDKDGDVDMEN